MDTLTHAPACCHGTIKLWTDPTPAFIDITEQLTRFLASSRVRVGVMNVQTTHTTTAIVVNEHEPLLTSDFETTLERLVPRTIGYAHDDMPRRIGVPADEPPNGHAHCRALLLPTSTSLNIVDGRIALGRWQRVFLVEFDGPRKREVSVVVIGEWRP
jgi:secondary thiamine-phosphate synthase enzyme